MPLHMPLHYPSLSLLWLEGFLSRLLAVGGFHQRPRPAYRQHQPVPSLSGLWPLAHDLQRCQLAQQHRLNHSVNHSVGHFRLIVSDTFDYHFRLFEICCLSLHVSLWS